jgi:hypothetical protein
MFGLLKILHMKTIELSTLQSMHLLFEKQTRYKLLAARSERRVTFLLKHEKTIFFGYCHFIKWGGGIFINMRVTSNELHPLHTSYFFLLTSYFIHHPSSTTTSSSNFQGVSTITKNSSLSSPRFSSHCFPFGGTI